MQVERKDNFESIIAMTLSIYDQSVKSKWYPGSGNGLDHQHEKGYAQPDIGTTRDDNPFILTS